MHDNERQKRGERITAEKVLGEFRVSLRDLLLCERRDDGQDLPLGS